MSEPLFRKVDAIQIPVPDLDAGLAFYRDRLGHELIWRTPTSAGLRMPDTDTEIVIQTERKDSETDLLVATADAATRMFTDAGGRVVEEAFDIPIGRCAVVADPWGNRLVLLDTTKGTLVTDDDGTVRSNLDGSPQIAAHSAGARHPASTEPGSASKGAVRPLLVIVSGAPATGKTTLARQLAPELGLVLLAKDDIKETLAEQMPPRSLAESRALGDVTFRLLFHLAHDLLTAGVGLVIEAAFYRDLAAEDLRPLVERARAVLIHCYAPPDLWAQRYRERDQQDRRHPAHFDAERIAAHSTGIRPEVWDRYVQPPAIHVPTLLVDTTDGYVASLDPIIAFVRSAGS